MPEINFKKNSTGWPLLTTTPNAEVGFSGVFEKNRIFREELNTFAGYLERGMLWILFFAGLICLGLQVPHAYRASDWQFLLRKNFYNFFFWLSAYTTTYLWARGKYYKTKKIELDLKNLEQETTADLYQYFSKQAKAAWNQAFKIAKQRTGEKEAAIVCLTDVFLGICQNPGAQTGFVRLGANPSEMSEFLKNFSKLKFPKQEKNLAELPFFAWQSAAAAQSKTITPLFLLCGLAKTLPKEHILQDMFFNLNITDEKLELVASWDSNILHLKEFPNNSYYKTLLACCLKARLLENHSHCLFRLDALEEAILLSNVYNKNLPQLQKAMALLVEATARAEQNGNKIITKAAIEKIVGEKKYGSKQV